MPTCTLVVRMSVCVCINYIEQAALLYPFTFQKDAILYIFEHFQECTKLYKLSTFKNVQIKQ